MNAIWVCNGKLNHKLIDGLTVGEEAARRKKRLKREKVECEAAEEAAFEGLTATAKYKESL